MHEKANEAILLTYDEIRILLYSQGYTACEGIYMPEKQFSAQEVLQTMHRLAGRGLLIPQEETADAALQSSGDFESPQALSEESPKELSFVLRPDICRMVLAMGNPAGSFIYRPGENLPGFSEELYNGAEYYCYVLQDYYLVTERDWTRRESIRLRAMDPQTFEDWRKEREQEAEEESLTNLQGSGDLQKLDSSEKKIYGEISPLLNLPEQQTGRQPELSAEQDKDAAAPAQSLSAIL